MKSRIIISILILSLMAVSNAFSQGYKLEGEVGAQGVYAGDKYVLVSGASGEAITW